MQSTQRQIGTAASWSVFARSGRFVLGIASSIIVVRGLGSHDYGVLSLIRTLLAFIVILAGAGMGQALLKFLPGLKIGNGAAAAKKLVLNVIIIQVASWVLLLVVSFFSRPAMETLFRIAGVGNLLFAAVAMALFELFFTILTRILNAYYDMKLVSIAGLVSHVVYLCLLFVLIPHWNVIGVIAAGAAGNLLAVIIVSARAASYFSGQGLHGAGNEISSSRLFRFSLPFAVVGVLNVIVWRQSETLFLAHYHGAEVTGYFDLAYRLPQIMLDFVPTTIWPLVMAGFSEVYARDGKNLLNAIERYYKVLFMLSAPICMFGLTLGGRIVPILFGDQMIQSGAPARVFFCIFTVSFFATPLSMSLYVLEKSYANMLIYMILAVINVGLDFVLIPRYGLLGAVFPVGLAMLVSPFIYYAVLSRYVDSVRIPFAFIGKCFAASLPILLLLPFERFVDAASILIFVSIVAVALAVLGFKMMRVLGSEETEVLLSVPFPMLGRLVRFISS